MKKLFLLLLFILTASNAFAYEQVLKHLDEDGITRWTDVYSGPEGDGKIEWEQKTEGGKNYVKAVHTGPEDREVPTNWQEISVPNE